MRQALAEYYAVTTGYDKQIGRILEELERSGLAKDTLVIIASDNGLSHADHGLIHKQSLYETELRNCGLLWLRRSVAAGVARRAQARGKGLRSTSPPRLSGAATKTPDPAPNCVLFSEKASEFGMKPTTMSL